MAKTKKLIYKGVEGYLEGIGFVKHGDEVTLEAERAKALLEAQPYTWDDRAAPDKLASPPKPDKGQEPKKKKTFREDIVEKDGGKK